MSWCYVMRIERDMRQTRKNCPPSVRSCVFTNIVASPILHTHVLFSFFICHQLIPINNFAFSLISDGRKKIEDMYHPTTERSEFYAMSDVLKPPVLFTPDEQLEKVCNNGPFLFAILTREDISTANQCGRNQFLCDWTTRYRAQYFWLRKLIQ